MRRGIVILWLLLATALQPVIAMPVVCFRASVQAKSACADCCHKQPCCTTAQQTPVRLPPAVQNNRSSVDIAPALMIANDAASPLAPERHIIDRVVAYSSHAPPPRALNCIQLI